MKRATEIYCNGVMKTKYSVINKNFGRYFQKLLKDVELELYIVGDFKGRAVEKDQTYKACKG